MGAVDVVSAGGLDIRTHVGELGAHVLLPPAELGGVDGDEQALAASLLGVLYDALGDGAVFVHIQLQPLDLTVLSRVDNFVKGAGGEGGDHLNDIVFVGAAGKDDFAFGVSELAESSSGYVEGDINFGAKHGGREVDLLNVVEDARPEPDFVEGGVVFAHCLSVRG